jgi:CheY-like chemotaxis protein
MKNNDHSSTSRPILQSNNALKGIIVIGAAFSTTGAITAIVVQNLITLSFFITITVGYSLAFLLYRKELLTASVLLSLSIIVLAAAGSALLRIADPVIMMMVIPVVLFFSSIPFPFRTFASFSVITIIVMNGVLLWSQPAQEGLSTDIWKMLITNGIAVSAAIIGRLLSNDLLRTSRTEPSFAHSERSRPVKGTILIVDDNEKILDILSKSLAAEGYKIFPFSSALALTHWLANLPESFDLLITDYFLNESDGRIVIEQVRKILPSVPIILISGYPLNKLSFDSDYYSNVVFMQKPFSAQEVIETIERMIR